MAESELRLELEGVRVTQDEYNFREKPEATTCGAVDPTPNGNIQWVENRIPAKDRLELDLRVLASFIGSIELHADTLDSRLGPSSIKLATIHKSVHDHTNYRVEIPIRKLKLSVRESHEKPTAHIAVHSRFRHAHAPTKIVGSNLSSAFTNLSVTEAGFETLPHDRVDLDSGDVDNVIFEQDGISPLSADDGPSEREDGDSPTQSSSASFFRDPPPMLQTCVRIGSTYEEIDIGEDNWTVAGTVYRAPRGMRMDIYRDNVFEKTINLNDDACLYQFTAGTYKYRIFTEGVADVVSIRVFDSSGATFRSSLSYTWDGKTFKSHTFTFSGNNPRTNIYLAAHDALSGHNEAMGASSVDYMADGSNSSTNPNKQPILISIASEHWNDKYVVAHETGHAYAWLAAPFGNLSASDLSFNSNQCPALDGSHDINSEEWQSGAISEGWADFYGADAFSRDTANSDCVYRHPGLNCDDGDSLYPLAYEKNKCGAEPGKGVELDWMRVYWNLHTSTNASNPNTIPMTYIMNEWIRASAKWSKDNAYSKLNDRASLLPSNFRSIWNDEKVRNGVNLP